MREAGRPLKSLPFPAAIYVLNHDNNLHYSIKQNRQDTIPRKIREHQVPLSPALIEEFSLPSPSVPLAASTASPTGQLSPHVPRHFGYTRTIAAREGDSTRHLGKIWVYNQKCLVAKFCLQRI